MAQTSIEWTDRVWNPVTGCTKVSAGCDHCYAEGIARRFAGSPAFPNGFDVTLRPERLEQPLRWRKPSRVFVNSMSDLFHTDVPDAFIAQVFAVMAVAEKHTFQVLTKRHGRMRSLLRSEGFWNDVLRCAPGYARSSVPRRMGDGAAVWAARVVEGRPLRNVWLGVSVEDQQRADLRIPALLDTPAAVRFLSCEPLLGPVDLARHLFPNACPSGCGCRWPDDGDRHECACDGPCCSDSWRPTPALDWVIVGGESGAGARPMGLDWAHDLVYQCRDAEVPVFVKQLGSAWARSGASTGGGLLGTPRYRQDAKGADWGITGFPHDLKVREWPAGSLARGAGDVAH